jgi:hypothetical protein
MIGLLMGFIACETTKPVQKGNKAPINSSDYATISFNLPQTKAASGDQSESYNLQDTTPGLDQNAPDTSPSSTDSSNGNKPPADWSQMNGVIYRLTANKEICAKSEIYTIDAYEAEIELQVDPRCDYKLGVKVGREADESTPSNRMFVAFYQTEKEILVTSQQLANDKVVNVEVRMALTAAGHNLGFSKPWIGSNDFLDGTTEIPPPPGGGGEGNKLTYQDMKPIIDQKCAVCHNPQGSRPNSDLSNYTSFMNFSQVSAQRAVAGTMPPQNANLLTQEEKDKFSQWQQDGFLEAPTGGGGTGGEQPPPNGDPNIVEFRIKAGTGQGPWNTQQTPIVAKVGQTIRLINDDSIQHQLHTNGRMCPHGDLFGPGETYDCKVQGINAGQLYDHNYERTGKVYFQISN